MDGLPVYWINLESSKHRRESLLKELQRVNITDQQRVAAVSPSQLCSYDIYEPENMAPMIPAEWCCTLSHLKAIWTAYRDCQEVALIIEDDVRVIRSPVDAWKTIKDSTHQQWDILQMLSFGDTAVRLMLNPDSPLWVSWKTGIWSTGAYIINRAGMERVLQTYVPEVLHRDTWLSNPPTLVDFSGMCVDGQTNVSRCVADHALYVAVRTLSCTDVFFTEAAQDSTIKSEDLHLHSDTITAIKYIADKKAFKLPL